MKHPADVVLSLYLSPEEVSFLDRMIAGEPETMTRCNMVRSALWSLADFMGYDPPLGVFDMRDKPRGRGKKGPVRRRIRKPNPPRHGQHGNPQPKNHPWRD